MAAKPVAPAGEKPPPSSRESLLEAAGDLMRERDTLHVPLADIAGRAGVNSALVKYYFGNKSGLMLALLERDLTTAITQLGGLVETDMRPAAKMRYHLSGLIRMYFRHPYLQRLLMATMRDESEAVARQIAERYLRPINDAYARMIADGVAAGEFKPIDARFFYFTVIGASDQIFSARFVLKYVHGIEAIDEDLRRAYVDQTIQLIMDGLLSDD